MVKNPPANSGDERDEGLVPGLGRSPGVGNGNALYYSCLENPMDRGAWRATLHGATNMCAPPPAQIHSRSPLSGGSQALLSLELVPLVNQVSLVAQMVKNLPAMWET